MSKKKKYEIKEHENKLSIQLKKLGNEFIQWTKHEDALVWKEFFLQKDIVISDVFNWMINLDFAKQIEVGKYFISCRREKLAMHNKVNAKLVEAMMPLYDKEYFDYKMALLKDNSNSQGTVKILVENYPTPENFQKKNK